MLKIFLSALFILLPLSHTQALVGGGGYVPFGFNTQKSPDGGDNKFSLHPMLSLNGIWQLPYNHLAVPELGVVFHRDTYDETSKTTLFILWDVAYVINQKFAFRYGLGTFMTKISGDGGTVRLRNGNDYATFAAPDETATSYNTTLNLGVDFAYNRNYTFKFETYVFGAFDSLSRKVSYSLSLNYYM